MKEQNNEFEATGILVPMPKDVAKSGPSMRLETEGKDFLLQVPRNLKKLLDEHLWEKVLLKGTRKRGTQIVSVKAVQSVEERESDLDIYEEETGLEGADADISDYAVSIRQTGSIYPDVAS